MNKILYIQASPRTERSWSKAVANAFIHSYLMQNPGDTLVTLDLFNADLPAFDGRLVEAKYNLLHGKKARPEERAAWKSVEKIIEQFKSADKYIISTPMWNFGLPYILKQYIDLLLQPSYTFSFTPQEGYKGLVTGKPVLVVYARGGEYKEGTQAEAMDYQTRYLELVLGFIGFTDIQSIVVEPTLQGGPDVARARKEAAIEKASEKASSF